jgi:glycerophosphoryl diester phosphodiesterase
MFPQIIGHRGFPYAAPENTMASYIAAVDAGADGLEIDLHMTADGEPVLIHDDTLDRTTNGLGPVAAHTLAELRKLSAGTAFGRQFPNARIPALREFLDYFAGLGLFLMMELKQGPAPNPGIEQKVIALLHEYQLPRSVILSSFSSATLETCKRIDPLIKTGILYKYRLVRPWNYAKSIGADCLCPQFRALLRSGAARVKQKGLLLYPFTVNHPRTMKRMIRCGVTGIITDRCDLLKKMKSES